MESRRESPFNGSTSPRSVSSAKDFLLGPPPALTSEAYTKAYNEVMTVGAIDSTARPARSDQPRALLCGHFANPGIQSGRPPVSPRKRAVRSPENARALALVNMAISDSLVATFLNKYHYNFWRPETAIHAGDTDGNRKTEGDPNWAPFITTPCFPSYPSNHGSAANAAAAVLRRLYGEAAHSITLTNPAVPTIVLQYDSFKEITHDISDARVYGGIHFRTDQRQEDAWAGRRQSSLQEQLACCALNDGDDD